MPIPRKENLRVRTDTLIILVALACAMPAVRCSAGEEVSLQAQVLAGIDRQYILIAPENDKAAFYWDGEINLYGRMGQEKYIHGVGEEFMPFGRDEHATTTARILRMDSNSMELFVKDRFDARSFGGDVSSREGTVVVAFSPPWKLAVYDGDTVEFAKSLESGLDVNARDGYGRSALMIAGFYGHKEIVSLLLEKGADISFAQKDGFTALTLSLAHPDIVALLVDRGAQITTNDLFEAASRGYAGAMKIFIARGANGQIKNQYGKTLSEVGAKYPEIVELFPAPGK